MTRYLRIAARIMIDLITLALGVFAILTFLWLGLEWADYEREQERIEQFGP